MTFDYVEDWICDFITAFVCYSYIAQNIGGNEKLQAVTYPL